MSVQNMYFKPLIYSISRKFPLSTGRGGVTEQSLPRG